jgi:hypothetical protein
MSEDPIKKAFDEARKNAHDMLDRKGIPRNPGIFGLDFHSMIENGLNKIELEYRRDHYANL